MGSHTLSYRDPRFGYSVVGGLLVGYLATSAAQNLASYSCSATPIFCERDKSSRLSRLVIEISRGTDGQTDATTETEGSYTYSMPA